MTDGASAARSTKWTDLVSRLGSGAILLVIGVVAVWFGGVTFHVLIAIISGLMIWELVRMLQPAPKNRALWMGIASGFAALLADYLVLSQAVALILAISVLGCVLLRQHRSIFFAYAFAVLIAGYGMLAVRDHAPFGWVIWLLAIVVVTDVAGYFAGRMLGGPKFWPRVSPKKTWSGTIAGWVGSAGVGVVFGIGTGSIALIAAMSVLLSFASQMGDIAESAIKRRMGVKDSSNLIPGHGGVLDRFDGMLGASIVLLALAVLVGFPPGLRE